MSKNESNEKHCKFCGKRLIDEKIPICLRCKLAGIDKAEKFAELVGISFVSGAIAVGCDKALKDNNKNSEKQ